MNSTSHEYIVSTHRSDMQLDAIHDYLAKESYWAQNIPRDIVAKSIAGSLCAGVFYKGQQIGFARYITDCATFAYLADVYTLEQHRGQGLARKMVLALEDMPELQNIRRWLLVTADAHGLYKSMDWDALANPSQVMERLYPDIYT